MKTPTDSTEILLATFPSLEAATKGINGYFFTSTISLAPALTESKAPTWLLHDSTGFLGPHHFVRQKKNRFHFLSQK